MYTISENHTSGRRINIATAELHAPNQFTQKLKLMGKSGLCIYASTLPPSRVAPSGLLDCNFCLKLHYLGLEFKTSWLWYYVELHAPKQFTQKLKLVGKGVLCIYTKTKQSSSLVLRDTIFSWGLIPEFHLLSRIFWDNYNTPISCT
jgi:hypothetical protein